MPKPGSFPLRAVAALFIARQHLSEPRKRRLTPRRLLAFTEDSGGIQLDSINVLERAHHLTLWARFGPYERAELEDWVYRRRLLFEYWAHAACLVPTSHFPAWRRAMLDYSLRSRAWGSWLKKNKKLTHTVEEQLRERGPLGNSDFREEKPKGGAGWWNWKPTTHALDYLWMSGRALVHSRVHFQKRFALAERVLPAAVALEPLDERAFLRWHVRQSLRAMGAATAADLRGYLSFPRGQSAARRRALEALLRAGEVVEVQVAAPQTSQRAATWYALADDLSALESAAARRAAPARGTTLLAPFDSLLWYRERAARLFGFDYKIEVYTPGEQRVHGYYVLPIFHDGRLLGRVDAKNHRSERRLEVRAVHFEPWFERAAPAPGADFGALDQDAALAGIADALHSLARFLHASDVQLQRVASKRLAAPLKRALKTWPAAGPASDNARRQDANQPDPPQRVPGRASAALVRDQR